MTKKSINIPLDQREFDALYAVSQRDLRHPREQARYILRTVLFADNPENSKTATSELFQGKQGSGFAGINP